MDILRSANKNSLSLNRTDAMPNNESQPPPTVQNKTILPPGVLPRNAQAGVIGGVAAVMAIVIAFSGSNAPKEKPHNALTASVTDPNQARIQEYRARIEEQAKKLAQEQAQLAQIKAPAADLSGAAVSPVERPAYEYSRPPAYSPPEAARKKLGSNRIARNEPTHRFTRRTSL
jgi:hypothetical protein